MRVLNGSIEVSAEVDGKAMEWSLPIRNMTIGLIEANVESLGKILDSSPNVRNQIIDATVCCHGCGDRMPLGDVDLGGEAKCEECSLSPYEKLKRTFNPMPGLVPSMIEIGCKYMSKDEHIFKVRGIEVTFRHDPMITVEVSRPDDKGSPGLIKISRGHLRDWIEFGEEAANKQDRR